MEEYQTKEIPVSFEIKDIQEDGTFSGFASTFGGKPDAYGDIVAKGAFANTLTKNGYGGNGIKMLWQHDRTRPIGVWDEMIEDSKGLRVRGKLAIKTRDGADAYELMKIGAINTLSIGFNTVNFEIMKGANGKQDTRVLKEVDLLEVSLVTFPANTSARVVNVKANDIDIDAIKDVRQLEAFLCDAGFSNVAARKMISICKARESERDAQTRILKKIEAVNASLKQTLKKEG